MDFSTGEEAQRRAKYPAFIMTVAVIMQYAVFKCDSTISCICRLIIKTCPLYPCHWVGKDHCCFRSGNNLTLIKAKTVNEDQYIEIRCKEENDIGRICYFIHHCLWQMIYVEMNAKLHSLCLLWLVDFPRVYLFC